MRIVLAIVAVLLLASPCSAGYRVRGYVVYQGQRILIVERTPKPRRVTVYRQSYPTPPMASPRRPYVAPPVAEPVTVENPWFTLGR